MVASRHRTGRFDEVASVNQTESYIRERAAAMGYDPDVVMQFVMNEGGVSDPVNRSKGYDPSIGGQEISYGPFQMNMHRGLGADLLRTQGVDIRDPANVYKGIDYSLEQLGKQGWIPWLNTMNKLGYSKWTGLKKGAEAPPATRQVKNELASADTPTGKSPYSLHVNHPPNPRVGSMDDARTLIASGQMAPVPPAQDDEQPAWGKKIADALGGMASPFGGGGGGGWGQIPKLPVPVATPGQPMPIAAPSPMDEDRRNRLAALMQQYWIG